MCVIIDKDPGKKILEEHIRSALLTNKDGYGIVILDETQPLGYTLHKSYSVELPIEEVQRLFRDNEDKQIYAHFRFSTRGKKNVENCHPFQIFSPTEQLPYSVFFMHNGTMTNWTDKTDRSDSAVFAQDFLSDYFRVWLERLGEPQKVFNNETFKTAMTCMADGDKFLLFDNTGCALRVGGGVKQEWGWSSNDYSFTRNSSVNSTEKSGSYYYSSYSSGYGNNSWNKGRQDFPWRAEGDVTKVEDSCSLPTNSNNNSLRRTSREVKLVEPTERVSFVDIADLNSIEDVYTMTAKDIEELIDEDPKNAVILVQDLIYELRFLKEELDALEELNVEEEEESTTTKTPSLPTNVP